MSLKRNLIANYIGQAWVALMNVAFIPLYIKMLGMEAYGVIGFFAMLQACLSLLDMGMTPTLAREMARFTGGGHSAQSIRDLLRSIEVVALGIALLMAGGVALASRWIASSWLKTEALPIEAVTQAFAIMGTVIALRFVEGIYRSAIVGLQRQVVFNAVNSAMATLRGAGSVGILIWISPSIEAYFFWQGAISLVALGILALTTYACLPKEEHCGRFSFKALSAVWRFAGGMAGITLLALLLTQVDKFLLSRLLPLSEFGHYALAGTVASALGVLITPITQALYPKLCAQHVQNDKIALADSYHKGAQLVSTIAGSAAIVLILFSETFLRLWTQDPDLSHRTANLLSVLTFGNLLNGLMWIPGQTQLAHGWTSLGVRINIGAILFIVPSVLWVVPHYGAVGAAWLWVALNAGYLFIAVQFMYRRILRQEKWRWYLQDVLIPLASALVAACSVKFACPDPEGPFAQIAILGLASILALGASGLASRHIRAQAQHVRKLFLLKFGESSLFRSFKELP